MRVASGPAVGGSLGSVHKKRVPVVGGAAAGSSTTSYWRHVGDSKVGELTSCWRHDDFRRHLSTHPRTASPPCCCWPWVVVVSQLLPVSQPLVASQLLPLLTKACSTE